MAGKPGKGRHHIRLDHCVHFAGITQMAGQSAVVTTQIKTNRKITAHQLDPVNKAQCRLGLKKIKVAKTGSRAGTIAPQGYAIKKPWHLILCV